VTTLVGTHRVRTAEGISLHAEVAGQGPTVVLVAGLGIASWWWSPLRRRLETDFRVVAFDNRGSGRSDKPDEPYSIEMLAADCREVVEQLGEPPVHVVGFSMGGVVSLALTLEQPELVRSLALLATSCGGARAVRMPDETARAVATAAPEDWARIGMQLAFAPGWTEAHGSEFEELLETWRSGPTPPFAWRRQYAAVVDLYERGLEVESIRQPLLVIHGTEDRIVPYPNAELLQERMPHAELVRLEGAGHYALLERPDAVGDAIIEFLARHQPAR
jgi:pimeloyl-ACP methyl ester carboxylesterase